MATDTFTIWVLEDELHFVDIAKNAIATVAKRLHGQVDVESAVFSQWKTKEDMTKERKQMRSLAEVAGPDLVVLDLNFQSGNGEPLTNGQDEWKYILDLVKEKGQNPFCLIWTQLSTNTEFEEFMEKNKQTDGAQTITKSRRELENVLVNLVRRIMEEQRGVWIEELS